MGNKIINRTVLLKAMLVIQALLFNLNAQNLVTNGNFEIYSQCPNWGISSSQIMYATGWYISGGSPDYWNACSNGVPNAELGYQPDCCGGEGYAGEFMICSEHVPGDDICREYMGTKLIDTLKAGHKYLGSIYVNRADCNYSIATIGMLFTDTAIVLSNYQQDPILVANPQVKNVTLLSDTLNWMIIQDTFIAIGNEAYLTIGNFNITATSDTVKSNGSWTFSGDAYYYIDNVSVYDIGIAAGIEKNKNKEVGVSVYPNPSTGKLYISNFTANQKTADIEVTDISGKLISKQQNLINNGLVELNLDVTNGVYFVKVIANNGAIQVQKIVINK